MPLFFLLVDFARTVTLQAYTASVLEHGMAGVYSAGVYSAGGASPALLPLAAGAEGGGTFPRVAPDPPASPPLSPKEILPALRSHGWRKHSCAVARFVGFMVRQGKRNDVRPAASSLDMRYFSSSTFCSPHCFRFLMFFKVPFFRKN